MLYRVLDTDKNETDLDGVISVFELKLEINLIHYQIAVLYPEGLPVTDNLLLEVSTASQTDSVSVYLPFSVTHRICMPENLVVAPVDDETYLVNHSAQSVTY